ncbi:MAG TPA: ABC transporter substrate-binding protein [Synergistales bacterium]|nr:ABC transporter substrate-binding protein [Synergistales bacterium]
MKVKKGFTSLFFLAVFMCCVWGSIALAADRPVMFVDFSWDSVQFHNRVAGFLIEHGYDRDVNYTFAESMPGLLGVERGDIDLTMELWADNVFEWYEKARADGSVLTVGKVFPDAPQGWYVPTYVIEGDKERGIEPMAPDLKTVEDLRKYWELFQDPENPDRGRLYNGPSGWMVSSHNTSKIEAYGLSDTYMAFDPGSQSALAAAIVGAYEKGNPILAYYWEPTPIMGKLKMTMIEEPPYNEEVFKKNRGCAYVASKVLKLVNAGFAKENPDILSMLGRYSTTLAMTNEGLAYMKDNNVTAEQAARWFLKKYDGDWKSWVADDKRIANIEAALKEGN